MQTRRHLGRGGTLLVLWVAACGGTAPQTPVAAPSAEAPVEPKPAPRAAPAGPYAIVYRPVASSDRNVLAALTDRATIVVSADDIADAVDHALGAADRPGPTAR